jgi:hypothetical protein
LAEFLAGAVARYGSIRRAAAGIDIPYSTLRGWLRGRHGGAGNHGNAFLDTLMALLGDLHAMSHRLDVLEHMLGHERDAREPV